MRARKLQERERIRATVEKLKQAGKLDEAAKLAVEELAITRELTGDLHEDLVDSLNFLAGLQELRQEWEAARKARREVIGIRQRQPDRKEWHVGDAQRALADLDRRAALDSARYQLLMKAYRLNALAKSDELQGRYRSAEVKIVESLRTLKEVLGEHHADYAAGLGAAGALSTLSGDYARAEPLLRRASELTKKALGEEHPRFAQCLNNLGELNGSMGGLRPC